MATPAITATVTSASRIHVVVAGETLSTIANRYGTSVDALLRANALADRNRVAIGQRLVVP